MDTSPSLPTTRTPSPLIAISLVCLAFVLVFAFFQLSGIALPSRQGSLPSPTPPPTTSSPAVIVRDNDLFLLNPTPVALTFTHNVSSFDYSPTRDQIAYITRTTSENNQITSSTVSLLTLSPQTATSEILSLPTQSPPGFPDYQTILHSVAFSPDGSLLGITSSDSFWTYNLGGHQLQNIFSLPVTLSDKGAVYAYKSPLISPDNRQAILTRSYYEGGDHIVVDLNSQTLTEIPESSFYVSGKRVLHWYDPESLIIHEYTDVTQPPALSTIAIANPLDLKPQKSFSIPGSILYTDRYQNQLYLLSQTDTQEPSTSYRSQQQIIKLDLTTGQTQTLYDQPSTYITGNRIVSGLKLQNPTRLLIDLQAVKSPDPNTRAIFALDTTSPSPTPVLVEENATLYPAYQ